MRINPDLFSSLYAQRTNVQLKEKQNSSVSVQTKPYATDVVFNKKNVKTHIY